MRDHETIRALLPLAAAGALARDEAAAVEQHAAACPDCRAELDALRLYSRGLGQLPQPMLPPGLLQRTRTRLALERASAKERRQEHLTLALLVLFSWCMGLATWLVVHTVTGGVWTVFGANLADAPIWILLSGALTWSTAGVAALVLGRRTESIRRVL